MFYRRKKNNKKNPHKITSSVFSVLFAAALHNNIMWRERKPTLAGACLYGRDNCQYMHTSTDQRQDRWLKMHQTEKKHQD